MSYKVELTDQFKKEATRLSKKYHSLKEELSILFNELADNPQLGAELGGNVRKVRLAISSKNKGKAGGARVITYVYVKETTVLLLTIYNKGEKDTISYKEIKHLIELYA